MNPFYNFEQATKFEDEDRTIYALSKFMKLCADSNPNIVELLFVPQGNILYKTPEWVKVVKNKDLFLSKKAKYTFTGYAFSQLKSIKSHRKWFLNPPDHKPTREEFGLEGHKNVSNAWVSVIKTTLNLDLMKEEYHQEYKSELEYALAKKNWDNYMAWFNGRNPERKKTEEQFGYDTKMASHLFRLMVEGKELLLTGNITFPLKDADFVRDIKNGKYTYEEVIEMAEGMENDFETWYNQSPLPNKPDRNKLEKLYFEIIQLEE